MRQTILFNNQLVYEQILNWLGFAFSSDGREAGYVEQRPQTPSDLAEDAAYGVLEATNLIRRHGTQVNVIN